MHLDRQANFVTRARILVTLIAGSPEDTAAKHPQRNINRPRRAHPAPAHTPRPRRSRVERPLTRAAVTHRRISPPATISIPPHRPVSTMPPTVSIARDNHSHLTVRRPDSHSHHTAVRRASRTGRATRLHRAVNHHMDSNPATAVRRQAVSHHTARHTNPSRPTVRQAVKDMANTTHHSSHPTVSSNSSHLTAAAVAARTTHMVPLRPASRRREDTEAIRVSRSMAVVHRSTRVVMAVVVLRTRLVIAGG